MIRTRPGRSVSQIEPSSANASAQGATRPSATDFTVNLSGPGEVRAVAVGLAVVLDPALGVALDPPPRPQPVTARPISRVELTAARRGTTPMLARHHDRASAATSRSRNRPFNLAVTGQESIQFTRGELFRGLAKDQGHGQCHARVRLDA